MSAPANYVTVALVPVAIVALLVAMVAGVGDLDLWLIGGRAAESVVVGYAVVVVLASTWSSAPIHRLGLGLSLAVFWSRAAAVADQAPEVAAAFAAVGLLSAVWHWFMGIRADWFDAAA